MDPSLLQRRPKAPYSIRYLIISKEYSPIPFFPPKEFDNPFLHTIRHLPKNLIQLANRTTQWIRAEWVTYQYSGYDLQIIFEQNLEKFIGNLDTVPIVVVFIDPEVKNRQNLISVLDRSGQFYYLFGEAGEAQRTFDSPISLLKKWKEDLTKINEHFTPFNLGTRLDFAFLIPEELHEINPGDAFSPAMNNHCMLNQYIGNIWEEMMNSTEPTDADKTTREEQLKEFAAASARKQRMLIVNRQIDAIDRFRIALIEPDKERDPLTNIPRYVPIILTAPFHYPKLEQPGTKKREYRDLLRFSREILKAEQDADYRNNFHPAKLPDPRAIEAILKYTTLLVRKKSEYLDLLGYLHASFTYSPVLRLPLKGKSFNKFLSIFNPDRPLPSRQKFMETIQLFGEKYVEESMLKEVQEQFIHKDRQIVCISDLPVEWFSLGKVPLSFTHDITRIPELSYQGIMATYVKNEYMLYHIPADIISHTLVLLCAPTTNGRNKVFELGYQQVEEEAKITGFHTRRCSSIADAEKAIKALCPQLLIIDTHGKTLPKAHTTLLQIGDTFVGGDDLIKHGISAPLVVLSACNTIPNWGYFNPISNALMEAGAISVTGTFLPIGIISGTILYQRVLNNLAMAATEGLHQNWLNFISHCIRTQYFTELRQVFQTKLKTANLLPHEIAELIKKSKELTTKMINASMIFGYRRQIFAEAVDKFNELSESIKISNTELAIEHLLYTTIGRSDLVFFESWIEKNKIDLLADIPSM